jgi:hypothetical protein
MRHLSDHFVFFIVLGLFTCKIFYAAAYDGLEDVQLPVQAGDSRSPAVMHGLVPCHPAADVTQLTLCVDSEPYLPHRLSSVSTPCS